jgi:hypothetical protein
LKKTYPEDYKQYNLEEYPYFEFKSGSHTYANVVKKLSAVFRAGDYELIPGDTVKTLPGYLAASGSAPDMIFIDGCHDYEVVKSDWLNCETLFDKNNKLIIVFDDLTYEGVHALYEELLRDAKYYVQPLNENQFFVRRIGIRK